MMKRLFNIRIPSLFGIILLLLGVGVTSYLVDQGIIFEGRAAPEEEPQNIAITNVTSTGFTVMYTTDEAVPGTLTYGTETAEGNVAADDRDQLTGRTTSSTVHHITVKKLTPDTTYYFSILSGDAVFQNDEEPYEVTTAPELSTSPPETPPITGSLTFPEGADKEEVIILISSEKTQPISAIISTEENYSIPTTGLRSNDLSAFAEISGDEIFDVLVLGGSQSSVAQVLYSNMKPIPLIMFGQAYDFTMSTEPITEDTTASGSADVEFPDVDENTDQGDSIQIVSPEEEETFTDQQPVFTGTALPGEEIEVIIHSEEQITAKITADTDGSWEFRPEEPLEPGEHTITIKTRDITGTLREFTRSFTVFAQGSQFVEPSVSPTKAPTPTLGAVSPTPTISEPTPTTQPTMTRAPSPTITPIMTTAISPTPTRPPLEATGTKEVIIGGVIGITTIITGFLLFFLTKGSTL